MACMCGGQLRIATSDAAGLQRQHGGHGSVESVVSSLRAHVPGLNATPEHTCIWFWVGSVLLHPP